MSAIVSGVVGGLLAAGLTAVLARRVGRGARPGHLYYSPFLWILAVLAAVFALVPAYATRVHGHEGEGVAKALLFLCFSSIAVYYGAEITVVRGRFDAEAIELRTPWTGSRRARWDALVAVERNDWGSGYTLTFEGGRKIRLSRFLMGHLAALEHALDALDATDAET